jgi:two-component system NarL family sensor kinase
VKIANFAVRPWRARRGSPVSRAVVALVATAVLAFGVVGFGASVVAGHLARNAALAEALRSSRVVRDTVFAPLLPAAIKGDSAAIARLDTAMRIRTRDGSLVRIKVWRRDGTVVYSDDRTAMGSRFPLHADVAETIDAQKSTAAVSDLTDAENISEIGYKDLVEVYIPLTLDDGTQLAFEMYTTDQRVVTAEHQLKSQLVPFALLALLILLVTQLPVAVWLVRRVGHAHDERSRLLNNVLMASGRERRQIARDLHDGVVPDLASAGYAAETLEDIMPTDAGAPSQRLVALIGDVVQRTLHSLRTLMIDLYPPDLTAAGLGVVVETLADKLRSRAGITVDVAVALEVDPGPESAALVYRCVRECLDNIAKHAQATHAQVTVTGDRETIRVRLRDNGVGLPSTGVDRRAEGHFGLPLLCDAADDLGGHMRVYSGEQGGTSVDLDLPIAGASSSAAPDDETK